MFGLTAIPSALKLAGIGVVLALLAGAGIYVWHLRATVTAQQTTITA